MVCLKVAPNPDEATFDHTHDRRLTSVRRLALRNLRSDEGLALVETVAALLVFSLIMTGLAASMATFARQTAVTKARSAAVALAQELVEKARAVGYDKLENCTGSSPAAPATAQFRGAGTFLTVATGTSTNCITYQKQVPQDSFNFTVTRLVLGRDTKPDNAGQLQTEKYLVVQVAYPVAGGATKTYELDTIVNNKGALTVAQAQGVKFTIKDTSGNVIATDALNWNVTLHNTTLLPDGDITAQTDEGTYSALEAVPPGTYTCTVDNNNDSPASSYVPTTSGGANAGLTVDQSNGVVSGSCTVTANTVTDFVTTWTQQADCVSTTTKGSLTVQVTDSASPTTVISGATVTLTNVLGHSGTPAAATTDANGLATFSKTVPGDLYNYTISKSGYTTNGSIGGPVCVVANSTTQAAGNLTSAGCPYSSSKGTLIINVNDLAGADVSGATVTLTKITSGSPSAPGARTTDASGNATFSASVGGGSYTFTATKGGSGSGVQGPICVTAGINNSFSATLGAGGACVRDTGTKGKLSFKVTDQALNPIQNAVVTLTNVNGDGAGSVPKTTAAGTATSPGLVDDPYQYTVAGPTGYRTTDVLGPVCVVGTGTSTVSVILTGLMTMVVSVKNNDTLAWKTYQITVTDPTGKTTIQSITVPNSGTRNPALVTFPSMPTGNGYQVDVCAVSG